MNEQQISDIWTLFREYLDKKQLDVIAEKYVDLMSDYGVSDEIFRDCVGTDSVLDDAISYYLDIGDKDFDSEWE